MGEETDAEKIDDADKIILQELEKDRDVSSVRLRTHLRARGIKMTLEEVAERRRRMEIERERRKKLGISVTVHLMDDHTFQRFVENTLLDRIDRLIIYKLKEDPSISDSDLKNHLDSYRAFYSLEDIVKRKTELETKLISYKTLQNPNISDIDLRLFLQAYGLQLSPEEISRRRVELKEKAEAPPLLWGRTTWVKVTTALTVLCGFVELIIGGLLLFIASLLHIIESQGLKLPPDLEPITDMLGAFSAFLGTVLIIFMFLSFILAYGLWTGKGWSWTATLVISAIGVVLGVFTLPLGIILILTCVGTIYGLMRLDVKRFLGKAEPPPQLI